VVKVLRVQFLKTTFLSPSIIFAVMRGEVGRNSTKWPQLDHFLRALNLSHLWLPFKMQIRVIHARLDSLPEVTPQHILCNQKAMRVKSSGGPGQSQRAIANYASIQISGQLSLALGAVVWWWGPR
jgi:hypothetical protein